MRRSQLIAAVITIAAAVFLSTTAMSAGSRIVTPKQAASKKASAPSRQELAARQIIDKLLKEYKSVDSMKYDWLAEGMDTFTKDQQKNISGDYKTMSSRQGVKVEVQDKPKLVRGKYEIKFKKPYLSQMKIIKSDFTPKLIWGTVITYRSDGDPDVWWAKPKISPIAIKRNVEKDDPAGSITSNWSIALLYLQYYITNSTMSLQPDGVADGKECFVVRLNFDWNKRPKWNHKQPPFDDYALPEPIKKLVWKEMLKIEKQKFSYIDYYIEKSTYHLIMIEEYIDGKFHWRNTFSKVEVNTVNTNDF
ncbi:MAG TPA: hypothetical protein PLQ76_06775 [bacterium]|nr:hypothetical protein [bacterium]